MDISSAGLGQRPDLDAELAAPRRSRPGRRPGARPAQRCLARRRAGGRGAAGSRTREAARLRRGPPGHGRLGRARRRRGHRGGPRAPRRRDPPRRRQGHRRPGARGERGYGAGGGGFARAEPRARRATGLAGVGRRCAGRAGADEVGPRRRLDGGRAPDRPPPRDPRHDRRQRARGRGRRSAAEPARAGYDRGAPRPLRRRQVDAGERAARARKRRPPSRFAPPTAAAAIRRSRASCCCSRTARC